nr:MAG TPA: hypothetical protein [Bacteriophage sp.]
MCFRVHQVHIPVSLFSLPFCSFDVHTIAH